MGRRRVGWTMIYYWRELTESTWMKSLHKRLLGKPKNLLSLTVSNEYLHLVWRDPLSYICTLHWHYISKLNSYQPMFWGKFTWLVRALKTGPREWEGEHHRLLVTNADPASEGQATSASGVPHSLSLCPLVEETNPIPLSILSLERGEGDVMAITTKWNAFSKVH